MTSAPRPDPAMSLALSLLLALQLLSACFPPPPARVGEETFTTLGWGTSIFGSVCDGLDSVSWLPSCDHAVPVVGTALAYGACAVVFAEIAATPCIAAAGLSTGVGVGTSLVTKRGECFQTGEQFYDDCLTANWGSTKAWVQDARHDNVGMSGQGLVETAGMALDFVGSAIPVVAADSQGYKAGYQAARDEGAGVFKSLFSGLSETKAGGVVKTVFTGNTKQAGQDAVEASKNLRLQAWDRVNPTAARRIGNAGMTTDELIDSIPRADVKAMRWTAPNLRATVYETTGRALSAEGKVAGKASLLARVTTKGGDVIESASDHISPSTGASLATNGVKSTPDQNDAPNTPDPSSSPPGGPPNNNGAGPDGGGTSTNGYGTRHVTITLLTPDATERLAYATGEAFTISFRLHADQGLDTWALWLGSLKTAGHQYADLPHDATDRVTLNTQDHPLPAGHYAYVLRASDGSVKTDLYLHFDITDANGNVPNTDRTTDTNCQQDLNKNGWPDCIDKATTTFVAPSSPDGKPDWFRLLLGLLILLGFIGGAILALQGGQAS